MHAHVWPFISPFSFGFFHVANDNMFASVKCPFKCTLTVVQVRCCTRFYQVGFLKASPKSYFFSTCHLKKHASQILDLFTFFSPKICACMYSRPNFHLDHTPPDQNFNDQLEAQLTRRCFETVSKRGRSFISMTHVEKRMTHRIKSDRKQISYKIEKKKSIR